MSYHPKCDTYQVLEELQMEDSPCTAGVGKGFVEEAGLQRGLRRKRIQSLKETSRGKGAKGGPEQRLGALDMGILMASGEIFTAELGAGY